MLMDLERVLGTESVPMTVALLLYYLAWLAILIFIGYLGFEAMKYGL